MGNTIELTINHRKLIIETAESPVEQIRGLSGRLKMNSDEGMLFVFPDSRLRLFHMYNMNFPLDIVWISESGRIIDTVENAQVPRPGLERKDAPSFASPMPCKYVLELLGGTVTNLNIRAGDVIWGLPKGEIMALIIAKSDQKSSSMDQLTEWLSKQEEEGEIDLDDWSEGDPRLKGVREEDIIHIQGNIDYDPANAFWIQQSRKRKNE